MGFSASDVVPFTQARSHLSELADQAKARADLWTYRVPTLA